MDDRSIAFHFQVLAQGDLFLNSSVSEGLPLAIIEASRAGLVVVATDVGGEWAKMLYCDIRVAFGAGPKAVGRQGVARENKNIFLGTWERGRPLRGRGRSYATSSRAS